MALDAETRDQLFRQPGAPIIAIERPGRAPLAVPIWHAVDEDGTVWILTPADSLKARLLRDAGRCSLVVEEHEGAVRYASADCAVVDERPATRDDREAMARRQLPQEAVDGYLAFEEEQLSEKVRFTLRPERWLSAQIA